MGGKIDRAVRIRTRIKMWFIRRVLEEVKLLCSYGVYQVSILLFVAIVLLQKDVLSDGKTIEVLGSYIGLVGVLDVAFRFFIEHRLITETHLLLRKYKSGSAMSILIAICAPTVLIVLALNVGLSLLGWENMNNIPKNILYSGMYCILFSSIEIFFAALFRNYVCGICFAALYWLYSISITFSTGIVKAFSPALSILGCFIYLIIGFLMAFVSELLLKREHYR